MRTYFVKLALFILLFLPGIVWGLTKKQLFEKKLTFSQFAIQQHINFKPNGTYELYLEDASSPRTEKGKFKIQSESIHLKFQKCEVDFLGEEISAAEKANEKKLPCGTIWGDLICTFESASAVTYSEVMVCDRKKASKKTKEEKKPLLRLQNINSRPKPNDIVQIDGRNIRILPEKPIIVKNSTNIYNKPDETAIRSCPGPVACKAPFQTEIGKQMHPYGITVEKYIYKGNQIHWYIHGSDEYGLWYLPETGVE